MSFLERIEGSFQEAETWLQESETFLSEKGYGQYLAETISYVQQAKLRVATLRQNLPEVLDQRENEILNALYQERAQRNSMNTPI